MPIGYRGTSITGYGIRKRLIFVSLEMMDFAAYPGIIGK
jgi:hypothetical protein